MGEAKSTLRGSNLVAVDFLCNRDVWARFKAVADKYDVTPGTMLAVALDALGEVTPDASS